MSEFPNKETQFKKGNPGGGHPKGVKNRSTILKKWIEVAVKIKEKGNPTGKEINGTVEDQINLALLYKAMAGDVQAIKEVNDTLYGKIQDNQKIDINIPTLPNINIMTKNA